MRQWIGLIGGLAVASITGCAQLEAKNVTAEIARQMSASMLTQAQWQDLVARLDGHVGPESLIEVEGYAKQAAGARIYVHGSSLNVGLEGQGTGGNPRELELYNELDTAARRGSTAAELLAIVRSRLTTRPAAE